MSEKVEQAHIVQLIRTIGGAAYVLGTRRPKGDYPGTRQTPGVADVIAFVPKRWSAQTTEWLHVYIECKTPRGRLSPAQHDFHRHCVDARIEHIVGGLDAVIAWLVSHGVCRTDQFAHYRVTT